MTKITSDVVVLSELLGSRCFVVPWHQRYFDWRKDEVRELIEDIGEAVKRQMSCYFVGSIMLVKPNSGRWEMNDGQQRLLTLSLLIAALCRRFQEAEDGSNETLALRALFERPDSQVSQMADVDRYRPRIKPQKQDGQVYRQIIRGNNIGTNGKLADAFSVIQAFVQDLSQDEVDRLFDFVMHRIEMSVLIIPTSVDVNSFFEALNARGKELNDVDLIRNRLYSYFSDVDDLERRTTVHENLEATVIIGRSAAKVQDYFRCYLQCQYGHLRRNYLYRDARIKIEAADQSDPANNVLRLVEGLGRHENIELFRMISSKSADPDFYRNFSFAPDGLESWMYDLRRYTVSHPVIFSLLHRMITETDSRKKKKTKRLMYRSLKNLASFVLRTAFVLPKFEPSRFDASFADLGTDVFHGSTPDSLDIMDRLEQDDDLGIISDSSFSRQMEVVQIRDSNRARILLFGINAIMQSPEAINRNGCSVEHVLPVSPVHWEGWSAFAGHEAHDYVRRTGNMVVLPKSENRSDITFNANYDQKRYVFENSSLGMPRDLAKRYIDWTPHAVEERSRQLARLAARAWPFEK